MPPSGTHGQNFGVVLLWVGIGAVFVLATSLDCAHSLTHDPGGPSLEASPLCAQPPATCLPDLPDRNTGFRDAEIHTCDDECWSTLSALNVASYGQVPSILPLMDPWKPSPVDWPLDSREYSRAERCFPSAHAPTCITLIPRAGIFYLMIPLFLRDPLLQIVRERWTSGTIPLSNSAERRLIQIRCFCSMEQLFGSRFP